jgi:hypothetical protein
MTGSSDQSVVRSRPPQSAAFHQASRTVRDAGGLAGVGPRERDQPADWREFGLGDFVHGGSSAGFPAVIQALIPCLPVDLPWRFQFVPLAFHQKGGRQSGDLTRHGVFTVQA